MKVKCLLGQQFGRLTVIARAGFRGTSSAWLCQCECGNTKNMSSKHLRGGATKSCGCLLKDTARALLIDMNYSHGLSRTRLYKTWTSMHQRCTNTKNKYFYNYGGRGIKVDQSWDEFQNFVNDMGYPQDGQTLDRIDNDKGYSKDNCKWSDRFEQMRNTRRTVKLEYNGVTKCLKDWAAEVGIGATVLKYRVNKGWSAERIFTTPVGPSVRRSGK